MIFFIMISTQRESRRERSEVIILYMHGKRKSQAVNLGCLQQLTLKSHHLRLRCEVAGFELVPQDGGLVHQSYTPLSSGPSSSVGV